MKKFWTIFKYTYLWNILTKGFIITTIIGIILLGISFNLNVIKDKIVGSSREDIAVCDVDESFDLSEDDLDVLDLDNCNIKVLGKDNLESEKDKISDGKGSFDCIISLYSKDNEKIEVFSKNNSNSECIRNLTSILKNGYVSKRAVNSNLDPEVLQKLMADIEVNEVESDEEKEGNSMLVYVIILVLFLVIVFYGIDVLNSVVEEKNNRIMETLITMANAKELFFGKVLGVCAVTLTQLVIFIVCGVCFMNFNEDINDLISKFNLNLTAELVTYLVVFVLLGYLLYAFIFAALGSLVSSTQDSTQAVLPITFFLMGLMMTSIFSIPMPDSTFAVVMSYVPFSSPIFMFESAVLTDIPTLNVLISIGILLLTIILIGILSSKVYRKGVLHYGKRASYFKLLLNKQSAK